jgi:hypothetical protein
MLMHTERFPAGISTGGLFLGCCICNRNMMLMARKMMLIVLSRQVLQSTFHIIES